jgi:uncharacterized protein (TIGR02266 family)
MRAVVSLVARYRSPTTFEYAHEACGDVSVGGMFITSAAPAPAGTLLKLECETDNQDAKIRGVARVVWLRRETNEHGPSGMGVKFVKLEAGSRELIEAIVERLAEAGVQSRSVSAAPEQRLAAGGGASFSAEPAPRAVQLVQSTPPAAAGGETSPAAPATDGGKAGPKLAAAGKLPLTAAGDAAPSETSPQRSPAGVDPSGAASADDESAGADANLRPVRPVGSSRPTAPQPSRFGWKFWVGAIVLVLIAIAIADRRRSSPTTPLTPESPSQETAPEPQPSAASPKPAAEPAPAAAAPTPEPQPAAAAPTAAAAEPSAEPKPAAEAPAAAARPTEEAAAEPPAATIGATTGATTGPVFPVAEGQPAYEIEFVSRPNEATVTIDDKATVVTPQTLNLGGMPPRIKVTAKKPGFKQSSIWLSRDGFELRAGTLRRRVYITLKPDTEPQ